ncbi:MAG: inositol monophosphatase family protein [Bacteroidetes bacterium]|nr:inositol monophosphatase family protein [Bacteroidota bacterium]
MIDFENITSRVCTIARNTGEYLLESLQRFKTDDILEKSLNNFVSWVDKSSEQQLVEKLTALLPGSGFIVEENTIENQHHEFTWVVDPLDGTTNFIHGIPVFCISIGLMQGDSIVSGVVHEVNRDECFYGWKGGGSFLNGVPIRVSATPSLKDSLLATGFPYYDYNRLDPYLDLFRYMMQHSHGVRRLGSAAADLAYVACGRFDGFYEYGLSPWDVAAGSLIIREAGGQVSDFSGGENFLFGKEIVSSNALVYNEFIEVIKKFF